MTTIDYAEAAYAQLPNYSRIQAALGRAQRVHIAEPAATMEHVVQEARRALLDGESVGDLARAIRDARADTESWNTAQEMKAGLIHQFEAELTNIRRLGCDQALRFLSQRLEELLKPLAADAHTLAKLGSADDAITAGAHAVTAWSKLAAAAAELDGIRQAQRRISLVAQADDPSAVQRIGAEFGRHALIADAGNHEPMASEGLNPDAERVTAPWPADALGQLMLAIRGDARLWVPTLTALEAAIAAHQRLVSLRRGQRSASIQRMDTSRYDREIAIHQQDAALRSVHQTASNQLAGNPFA